MQHIPGRNTPRRRRRHRRSSKHSTFVAILLGSLAAVTPIVIATWPAWGPASPRVQTDPHSEPAPTGVVAAAAEETSPPRPNYRYSVVPGGVHTRHELLEVIGRDAVVASHYRTLSPDHVQEERLSEERRAYVSYRMGDRVYWTKEKVTLPAGEPILTDGVTQIRARCGNRIAYAPQLPTSDEQPDVLELDALAPPAGDTVPLLAAMPLSVGPQSAVPLSVTPGAVPSGAPAPSGLAPLVPSPADRFGGWYPPIGGAGPPATPTRDPGPDASVPGLVPPIPVPEQSGPEQPGPPTPPTPEDKEPVRDYWPDTTPKQPVSVPEPSTIVLLGTGAAGIVWRRVRSRWSR